MRGRVCLYIYQIERVCVCARMIIDERECVCMCVCVFFVCVLCV